jgi:hypothetical protein
MKLSELEPTFLKAKTPTEYEIIDSLSEADGVSFLCPVCFIKNKGSRGTHSIVCWRPHVSLDYSPRPGRWQFVGTSLADLSLDNSPNASSVFLTGGCMAHFSIKKGEIV